MGRARDWRNLEIFAVGHSTRSVDELVALLQAHGVRALADIRTIPRSRHNPQFNEEALARALGDRGIRYTHLAALGGLRRARRDSPNGAWRNASFRGYADYMQTPAFAAGLEELRAFARGERTAIMCAEAVPWRCHRSLVADALTARGARVFQLASATRAPPHRMTPFAEVHGTRVTYPADPATEGRLPTRGPFHLEATVRVLQRRPTNAVETFEDGRYRRVRATAQGPALVSVWNEGTLDAPALRFAIGAGEDSAETRLEVGTTLRKVLALDRDPAPFERLAEDEKALRPTALALRGMRPPRFGELFEGFANVIPFQQVSLDAGIAVVGKLVRQFGDHLDVEGRRFFAFPAADAIACARLDALRRCGLSRTKAEALREAARAVEAKVLTEERLAAMPTPDALALLRELPGIGPWSAALVLLRGLGRLDVFPPGDVGVAKGLGALLHLRSEAALARLVERFGDLRGYLYFCALGANLLARGLIHPAEETGTGEAQSTAP